MGPATPRASKDKRELNPHIGLDHCQFRITGHSESGVAVNQLELGAMFTDAPPRSKTRQKLFLGSDRLETLPLSPDGKLAALAARIKVAMKAGRPRDVYAASDEFLSASSDGDVIRA
jgi:hypothetical protein